MNTKLLNMKDLGNGITTIGNKDYTIELDTEKLNKVRKDEPKLDMLARDLWKKDSKSIWYANIYHEKLLHEMQNYVSKKVDEISPEDIRPGQYLIDRALQLEHTRKSGRYFFYLLAMDYLDILDSFMKEYKIDIEETSDERKKRLSDWKY